MADRYWQDNSDLATFPHDYQEESSQITKTYLAEDGETFQVTFAIDAEFPPRWFSRELGKDGILLDESGKPIPDAPVEEVKEARTHWDMLLERRTIPELEEILQWRLDYYRAQRDGEAIKA